MSRASVYRILDELEGLGLVQRVETGQAMVRYERVCERSEHHHHLVCDECGVVMPFSDPGLERAIKTLSERVPLNVSEHEIVLHRGVPGLRRHEHGNPVLHTRIGASHAGSIDMTNLTLSIDRGAC